MNALEAQVKAGIYKRLFSLGLWEWAIARRSAKPSAEDRTDFAIARDSVDEIARGTFSPDLLPEFAHPR